MDFGDIRAIIASSLKIDEYPEETQNEIIGKLAEIAAQRVLLELTAVLPDGKRDGFLDLVEAGEPEKLKPFFEENIPDYANIIRAGVDLEVKTFLDAKARGFKD